MASCLGLYVEKNLIKYAKVSQDRNVVKVDSYGVKFFENVEQALQQIVRETYSYKTPISVNLSNERYTYANLFSLLNKNDLHKAINTEFDYFCTDTGKNKNALEYRTIEFPNREDKDKTTVLYSYADKTSIVEKVQMLDGMGLSSLTPIALTIPNLLTSKEGLNSIIVNIENKTEITTVIDGVPNKVDVIDVGMDRILQNIAVKENSFERAYEICKNTTIYTAAGQNLQTEGNEYLEDIVPTLYQIVQEVKEVISKNNIEVNEIYITGLGAVISNIDLYFQENFINQKCEILTPYFIEKTNLKINIKDYIEVNSAISLAMQGIGVGQKTINFVKSNKVLEKIKELASIEVGSKKTVKAAPKNKISFKEKFSHDLKSDLDIIEKSLLRLGAGILILIVIYCVFSKMTEDQIKDKIEQTQEVIADTDTKIESVTEDTKKVDSVTKKYEEVIAKYDEANDKITQWFARKNAIPNLLNEIMFAIPEEVQVLSISNTTTKHIIIEAQSNEHQYLGYFVAAIKTKGILTNVTTTNGENQSNNMIKITIEGDLSY